MDQEKLITAAITLVFSIGVSALAWTDKDFRKDYANVALIVLGGYLGQLRPDEHKKGNDK